MKISKIEPIVKDILEKNVVARNDDFILVGDVYNKINKNISKMPFLYILANHTEFSLPSIESITRCRRRLQSKYEHLRANKKTRKIRMEEEIKFREYARE